MGDLDYYVTVMKLGELVKQVGFTAARARLFHLRVHAGPEVDVVIEDARGRVVGVEIKAGASVGEADLRGLRYLAEVTRSSFVQGIVLHLGPAAVPFGPRLHALPLSSLWSAG